MELDELVAALVGMEIPYNNFVTGKFAFHHKAGMHTKAIHIDPVHLRGPRPGRLRPHAHDQHRAPPDGLERGRRAPRELGLELGNDEQSEITRHIKALADAGPRSMDQLDTVLRQGEVA